MLRKIVNMIMGSSDEPSAGPRTHFEALLEKVTPSLKDAFAKNGEAPLDALAVALLTEDMGDVVVDVNPQAARAYFSVLVENDRQPRSEQLTNDELTMLKALLLEYFSGRTELESKAGQVIALIERKFSEGAFTQARILLQIFETDHETRLNNERNLFYEDMILRLGVRRRHEIGPSEREQIASVLGKVRVTERDEVLSALAWLGAEYYIQLCLSVRDPREEETWTSLSSAVDDEEERERLLRYVPPRRWRTIEELPPEVSLTELLRSHISERSVKQYVLNLTRMCYFLLLASGDTGFESYLYHYLGWCRETLGVEGKRLLPQLHRRSVLEERSLSETLDNLYTEFFEEAVQKLIAELEDDALQTAWAAYIEHVVEQNINDIPPGFYDLGAFLLDHLLGFEQPTPHFAFRLYRLT